MSDDGIYQNVTEQTLQKNKERQQYRISRKKHEEENISGLELGSRVQTPRWDCTKFVLTAICVVLLCGIIVLGVLYGNKEKNPQWTMYGKEQENKTAPRPCDLGWFLHEQKCYLFSSEILQWTDSREQCRSAGGDLVTIESEEEQWFLVNHIKKTSYPNQFPFWIGLSDMEKEGQWQWSDGKSLRNNSIMFWDENQPDNGPERDHPTGQDCVWLRDVKHVNNWMDGYCTHLHGRICTVSVRE